MNKSPKEYKVEIDRLLEMVGGYFFLHEKPKKCEQVLMKKLNEVYFLFHSTGNQEYQKLFSDAFTRYDQIITEKIPQVGKRLPRRSKFLRLEDLETDSVLLRPEEMETEIFMWRDAIIIG